MIPVLRQRPDWLARCVRSALAQSVPTETIVVVAPATSAENHRLLEELESGRDNMRVLGEEGRGFAAALNTGIRATLGPRVGFLLSDDWLEERAVEACLSLDADIVSTGLAVHAAHGVELAWAGTTPDLAEFLQLPTLERKASYLRHLLLFRREALLDLGGVDESVGDTGPDDFDLVWSLLERGASVALVPERLYHYRDHQETRLSLRAPTEQIADLCRILDKHGLTGAERDEVIAWHSFSYGRPFHVGLLERGSMSPPGCAGKEFRAPADK